MSLCSQDSREEKEKKVHFFVQKKTRSQFQQNQETQREGISHFPIHNSSEGEIPRHYNLVAWFLRHFTFHMSPDLVKNLQKIYLIIYLEFENEGIFYDWMD